MWNIINHMGHSGHLTSPHGSQKRNFSFHVENVPIIQGKTFSNPNFVNKHHPSVHNYGNNFVLTPVHTISHNDNANVNNIKQPDHVNSALVNSSQSIIDKVKESCIDFIRTTEPSCEEVVIKPVMCSSNSRKRNNRDRNHMRGKTPGKNCKQNIKRQQIREMMDIDLEVDPSVNVLDISRSPRTRSNSFSLTDYIVENPSRPKPITIEQNAYESDEEEHSPFAMMEISFSPNIDRQCFRERQLSITESEDSFIVFHSETDTELEFSEESDDDDDESDEEDVDSSSSVIPHKRVRFADDRELCEVHPMVQWSFAYQQARKGPWEEYARDRDRFRQRIANTEKIISPVFDSKHRENVYRERFKEKMFAF